MSEKIINDFSITIATVNGSGHRPPMSPCCGPYSKWVFRSPEKTYSLPIFKDCRPGTPSGSARMDLSPAATSRKSWSP